MKKKCIVCCCTANCYVPSIDNCINLTLTYITTQFNSHEIPDHPIIIFKLFFHKENIKNAEKENKIKL